MTIIEIVQQFKSLDVNSISMKSKHFKVPLEYIYYSESSDGVQKIHRSLFGDNLLNKKFILSKFNYLLTQKLITL